MKVVVEYHGQMRAAMGRAREEFEVEEGCTVGKVMGARKLKGLMFVGTAQANEETVLRDGDVVILISPIAGG
jgi:molybdopterin converting factor small subunit